MVKSRLAAAVGDRMALSLYRAFVVDLMDELEKSRDEVSICFFPASDEEDMRRWLGAHRHFRTQRGRNLGDRMKNAFSDAFSDGFDSACIIGSDIPHLQIEEITEGICPDDMDVSIGPSPDGGYYLISFRRDSFMPEVFEDIEWGTDGVFRKTMGIFSKRDARTKVLPLKRDIDRFDDLKALYEENLNTSFSASRTMSLLRTLFAPVGRGQRG
jgi:uncharacterized protein